VVAWTRNNGDNATRLRQNFSRETARL
jgi:hypothetical protein